VNAARAGVRRAGAVLLAVSAVAALGGCGFFRGAPADQTQSVPSVSGPASVSTSGTPSASATASASTTKAAPAATPSPPAVPGYTLAAAPPATQKQFQSVASSYKNVFGGVAARTVVKGTEQVGTVVLLGLRPDLVGNKSVESRLSPGMVKGMSGEGAKVTTQKVGGVDVAVAKTTSTSIVSWYREGTLVLVLGNSADPAPLLTFSQAYIAAS
jgi:hypothetical protein